MSVFRPAPMKRVTVVGPLQHRLSLLRALYKEGSVSLIRCEVEGAEPAGITDGSRAASSLHMKASRIRDLLRSGGASNIIEMFMGVQPRFTKTMTHDEEMTRIEEAAELVAELEERIRNLEGSRSEVRTQQETLVEHRERTALWDRFGVEDENRILLEIVIGTTSEPERVEDELAEGPDTLHWETRELEHGRHAYCVLAPRGTEILRRLKLTGLEPVPPPGRIPDVTDEDLTRREQELVGELAMLAEEHGEALEVLVELLGFEREQLDGEGLTRSTKRTFVLDLWTPATHQDSVEAVARKICGDAVIVEAADPEGDEAPVLLDNPSILKSFELLTKTYGLPTYTSTDPTIIFAIFFPLFFGFMLNDFIYGLALLAVVFHLRKRVSQPKGARELFGVLTACALVTLVVGVFMGSFFGDLIECTAERGDHGGLRWPAIDVGPTNYPDFPIPYCYKPAYPGMANAETLLYLSFLVGLMHINLGILVGLADGIRNRDWKRLITEQGFWLLVEAGIVSVLLGATYIGIGLVALALLGFMVGEGPNLPIASFARFFDVTGFFGRVLSYGRLLAISLSGAGIAMVVNMLAGILGGISMLLGIPFLLLGHGAAFLSAAFGSFVHALRLHYVEHFSAYYEGGGTAFAPFVPRRVYTEVR